MIKIDKHVPIPTPKPGRKFLYPWKQMHLGDSFFVKGRTSDNFAPQASEASRIYGQTFTCRNVHGGVRVWLIHQRIA